ncbi:hypothetical protein [Mailhella massiliensis]|uniref:hypothetical protein n=1 Tax=Mailhella massiliensis TaxID=1903261 RepID=UPI001186BEF5|nr:hypothetical protein [Mailhella massiliensis]
MFMMHPFRIAAPLRRGGLMGRRKGAGRKSGPWENKAAVPAALLRVGIIIMAGRREQAFFPAGITKDEKDYHVAAALPTESFFLENRDCF